MGYYIVNCCSTLSVVQLVMTLNGTYTSFQDFVYTLYGYDYLTAMGEDKIEALYHGLIQRIEKLKEVLQ